VTELLERALVQAGPATVYACGPTAMMRRAAELSAASARQCFVSLENPMACGFGVCLGCAVPMAEGGFRLVCRDGPVFEASEIAWEKQG
jgi:dihydroorotate dehydrogenase electron transfer subunit